MNNLLRNMIVLGGLLYISCGFHGGGGTIETTNGFTAQALYTNGSPVPGAVVRIRTENYLPSATQQKGVKIDTFTDNQGWVKIDNLNPGNYKIEINDLDSTAVLFSYKVEKQETIQNLGQKTLKKYSSISGKIDHTIASQHTIQIYGLERKQMVDSKGTFIIDDLPEGDLIFRISSTDTLTPPRIDTVSTIAGDTVYVPLQFWSFVGELDLNTSYYTGLGEDDTFYNFPLLVRLNSGNFDFNAARESGQDIRFSKLDGTSLPFEIEYWNKIDQQASIWILLDTILGFTNNRLLMYWGNPNAVSQSSGNDVFKRENGFVGVWHLSKKDNLFKNSVGDFNHGVSIISDVKTGISGNGIFITDSDQFINCGSFANTTIDSILTISAWVKIQNDTDERYFSIASTKNSTSGQNEFNLAINPVSSRGVLALFFKDSLLTSGSFNVNYSTSIQPPPYWHFIASTIGINSQSLFQDGRELVSKPSRMNISLRSTNDLIIGGKGSEWFNGYMDELVLESVERTTTWLCLCYETRKPDYVTKINRN